MRKTFIYIAVSVLTHYASGQKSLPPPPATKKAAQIEERNHDCIKKSALSFTARLKKYPFNVSTQIQFVSFNGGEYLSSKEIDRPDSLPRINDSILYSNLIEIKTLTFPQVDKLSDILYNYGYRGEIHIETVAACYRPRNAILFLDSNNKVTEFIEICFECRRTTESSDKVSVGEMCEQKLDMLYNLFKSVGIEYGITRGVVPGE